jgi:large subunit ribosomal protein L21
MYAIVKIAGKQYRVQEGDVIDVDLLHAEDKALKFDQVLYFNDGAKSHVGIPYVPKCIIHAEWVGDAKGPKVIAFKYKRCKNYRRTVGHRQKYSRVKITKIAAA